MIRAAHIGVGISGREGRAAVLSSDFSFAQVGAVCGCEGGGNGVGRTFLLARSQSECACVRLRHHPPSSPPPPTHTQPITPHPPRPHPTTVQVPVAPAAAARPLVLHAQPGGGALLVLQERHVHPGLRIPAAAGWWAVQGGIRPQAGPAQAPQSPIGRLGLLFFSQPAHPPIHTQTHSPTIPPSLLPPAPHHHAQATPPCRFSRPCSYPPST